MIDPNEKFGLQDLERHLLEDLRQGEIYEIPNSFEPRPERWSDNPEAAAICEASRQGAWMLHHYLGREIKVDEKASAGDFFSSLDLSADLMAIYSLRKSFEGRVATVSVLDKQRGLTLPADDTAANIRARGESPVFFIAEESSPEFDISNMEPGDTVVFIDGMDGSSAAKFRIPGGASVIVGSGVVSLNEAGEKYIDLQTSSILFPSSQARGTESTWYFAEKGKGAYVKRPNGNIEKLEINGSVRHLQDANLILNRYGDASLETAIMGCLHERCHQPGQAWPIPSALTVGLPSSEHGLKVVDPDSGHQVAVSDNRPEKEKVGPWDLVTMLFVREAGGVVVDFEGNDIQIPTAPRPMIFAQTADLAQEIISVVKA